MEALKLILEKNNCEKAAINKDGRFEEGMTPLMMAACKITYDIISLLVENEHKLLELVGLAILFICIRV